MKKEVPSKDAVPTMLLLLAPLLLLIGCGGKALHPPPENAAETVAAADFSAAAAEHLQRGKREIEAAQRLRKEKSPNPAAGAVFSWPTDGEAYYRHYLQAEKEFLTILEEYRGSPSAPEAQFLLGLINDYPHLSNYDAALEGYRRTIEEFPGTPAAGEARRRMSVIEGYMGVRP